MNLRNLLLVSVIILGIAMGLLAPPPALRPPLPARAAVTVMPPTQVLQRPSDEPALGGGAICPRVFRQGWPAGCPWVLSLAPPFGRRQARALILTNPARLQALYPGDPQVAALEQRLRCLAADPRVDGLLLDVGADPPTARAYAAWDCEPTTARANQVAAQIKAQIDRAWGQAPALAYLVIVGDDRVIPFLRVPDRVPDSFPELYTEAEFANLLTIPATTTVGQALRDNQILTDDYYACNPARYGPGREPAPRYYLPELGTGRLVETPAEMLAVVETFLDSDQVLVSHGAVSAMADDYAADLAARECELMMRAGLTVDCALVRGAWSAGTFRDRLLGAGGHNEIIAIEHHASHLWFGPAGEWVYARDLAGAQADLARTLIVSSGCHVGLSVPPYASYPSFDLPQAALGRRANLLGSTGYAVACCDGVRWSEVLIERFERLLLSGEEPTLGRALVAAKAYYQRATLYDGATSSDEKASLELTLYGLPMYHYAVAS